MRALFLVVIWSHKLIEVKEYNLGSFYFFLDSILWHGGGSGSGVPDPPGKKSPALRHELILNTSSKITVTFQAFKHSRITWPIDSNHHRWDWTTRGDIHRRLNASKKNANLSSRGRSTKSKMRKRQDRCWDGLGIKASKSTIRTRRSMKATVTDTFPLQKKYPPRWYSAWRPTKYAKTR